jgi:hypothetical protein
MVQTGTGKKEKRLIYEAQKIKALQAEDSSKLRY